MKQDTLRSSIFLLLPLLFIYAEPFVYNFKK